MIAIPIQVELEITSWKNGPQLSKRSSGGRTVVLRLWGCLVSMSRAVAGEHSQKRNSESEELV